jgi:hypothetical protein
MNAEVKSSVDFQSIRQLYQSDSSARTILDEFAGFRRNTSTTALEQLLFRLTSAGKPVPKSEVIEVLRKLEQFGCGDFITGRKGHATRFEWTYPLSKVGKIAAGWHPLEAPETNQELTEASEDEDLDELADPPADLGAIDHSFQLRPGYRVEIRLPSDLTNREANRLSDFLKTLPFDAAAT